MLEEAAEQLCAARLADLGEEERQLGERRAVLGEALERALDAEGNLLEAIEREALEGLARRDPRLGRRTAEDVDEEVDGLRALEVTEEERETDELDARLVLVFEGKRCLRRLYELGNEDIVALPAQRCMKLAGLTFRIEKGL